MIFFSLIWTVATCAFLALATVTDPPPLSPLPKLQIDQKRVTVSGVSSGAFFASQFHLAHSKVIQGAGLVAGGLYGCARGDLKIAQEYCMKNPDLIKDQELVDLAQDLSRSNQIDPLLFLSDDRVYIFSAHRDEVIHYRLAHHIETFYQTLLPPSAISIKEHSTANHGFLSPTAGRECGKLGLPWLQNCGEPQALHIFNHLDPNHTANQTQTLTARDRFFYFNQESDSNKDQILFPWGALFVPDSCYKRKCGLHIAFHGCQMNPTYIGQTFILNSGYAEAAKAHDLVVLFPQVNQNRFNPQACWDWYGFTGSDYLSKQSPMIKGVFQMVSKLLKNHKK